MRRFFLALGVGVQVIAGPLPHVIQPAEGAAQGVRGHRLLRGDFQRFLEQGHVPTRVWVAEFLGRACEERCQQMLMVFVQQARTPAAFRVGQRGGVEGLLVGLHPVVNALARDAEHLGDLGGRAARVEFQDRHGTAIEARIARVGALAPQTASLPGSQVKPAHGGFLQC